MCYTCGNNYCLGACLTAGFGAAYQGQVPAQLTVQPTYSPLGYSLIEFLEVTADKADTEACIFFIEKQLKAKAKQIEQLELIKKQHQDDLDKAEKDFLNMCLKYRPSITPELIDKIKKLKAFY